MRPFVLAGLILAVAGGAAAAQTIYDDPGQLNALRLQAEIAQQQAQAAQQAADAAQARVETEARIGALNTQRITGEQALGVNTPQTIQGDQISAQMTADAARLAQLTDQVLAQSNARIVAIKPALR